MRKVATLWGITLLTLLVGCQHNTTEAPSAGNETTLPTETATDSPTKTEIEPAVEKTAYIETFLADGQRKTAEEIEHSALAELQQKHLSFAFDNYHDHFIPGENFVSAPFDLQLQLAIVALGAEAPTLLALGNASNLNLSTEIDYQRIASWEQHISEQDSVDRQHFLWGQERYLFSEDYLQTQAELFGPVMAGLDFISAAALSNTTLSETLTGLSLADIDERTRLIAGQTMHIDVQWSALSRVEKVKGRFYYENSYSFDDIEHVETDMMRIEGELNTLETEAFRLVEIPLSDPNLSLIIVTPDFETFMYSSDETIGDPTFLSEKFKQRTPKQTTVMLPLFEIETLLREGQAPDLGIAGIEYIADQTSAVQPSSPLDGAANFSKINNAGFLYLLPQQQRIKFGLSETGITSQTSSAIQHKATEDEPEWLLSDYWVQNLSGGEYSVRVESVPGIRSCYYPPDQTPFLFALYEHSTGTVLHLGHVAKLYGQPLAPDWTISRWSNCGTSPPIQVYKYSGETQCNGDGIGSYAMGEELLEADIEVLSYDWGHDGLNRPQVCDAATGNINIYTINEEDLAKTESLGFTLLTTE
ncbi:serpin family protein [Pseudomonadota bacterium]